MLPAKYYKGIETYDFLVLLCEEVDWKVPTYAQCNQISQECLHYNIANIKPIQASYYIDEEGYKVQEGPFYKATVVSVLELILEKYEHGHFANNECYSNEMIDLNMFLKRWEAIESDGKMFI